MDGVSNNDDAAALTGTFYGLDVVDELQVVTSGGQAEFGRALGGYVNVVSKSGTNTITRRPVLVFPQPALQRGECAAEPALPLTQAQFGASLGGPVFKNRTFYFANFEHAGSEPIRTDHDFAGQCRGDQRTPSGRELSRSAISTGIYPNPVHNENLFAKVDHEFGAKDQFTIRYSLYHVDASTRVARAG